MGATRKSWLAIALQTNTIWYDTVEGLNRENTLRLLYSAIAK
ncbi:hypothetical protein [Myxosarcina sp. GI1]|nr:hypothetical protein [Myxosarcina sp. GI1]